MVNRLRVLSRFVLAGLSCGVLIALGYLGCRTDFSDLTSEAPSCAKGSVPEGIGGNPPACSTCDGCADCSQNPCTVACDACGCECSHRCDGQSDCNARCSENTSCDVQCLVLGRCDLECRDCRRANFVCAGGSDHCTVDCKGAERCDVVCDSAATCSLLASDTQALSFTCGGNADDCRVSCTRTNDCAVECSAIHCNVDACVDGSSCSLRCIGAQTCNLTCPAGPAKECPDGTLVCPPDRECPPSSGTGGAAGNTGAGGN